MTLLFALEQDYIVMFGKEKNKRQHSHYAIQLLIPVNQININGFATTSSILIDSYVSHYVHGDAEILSLLIDPNSTIGRRLKQSLLRLKDNEIVYLNNLNLKSCVSKFKYRMLIPAEIRQTANKIIQQLLIDTSSVQPIDERISSLITYIKSSNFSELHYESAVQSVFLSKSRLTHLFKDEIGIPLGKYMMWKRLLHASIHLLTSKTNITTVAHEYGFADASHFSRTFKDHFGTSPREIFRNAQKNSHLVHVFY